MTSKLVGKWELESSEGIGFVKRKLANSIKPVMTISKDSQNWQVKVTLAGLKNIDITFTENVPYFESNPLTDKSMKALVKPDGLDKLDQELRDPDTNAIISTNTREIIGDKMIQTMNAGNIKAVRTFKRIS